MKARTFIMTLGIVAPLAAPAASWASTGTSKAPAVLRSSTSTLTTLRSSYVVESAHPMTYINVNACQLTSLCTPAYNPDDAGIGDALS